MTPAFLSALWAPTFWMILRPFAERFILRCFLSSGTKIFFFWMLAFRRRFPVGLNCVARVRFEYPPPVCPDLPVITHSFAICRGYINTYRRIMQYPVCVC